MDLRVYYQRIRETRDTLPDQDVVVISCETQDGGRAGVCTEVPKALAAKMIVDGVAEVANDEKTMAYRRAQAIAKEEADRALVAARIPLTVVSAAELNRLRGEERTN